MTRSVPLKCHRKVALLLGRSWLLLFAVCLLIQESSSYNIASALERHSYSLRGQWYRKGSCRVRTVMLLGERQRDSRRTRYRAPLASHNRCFAARNFLRRCDFGRGVRSGTLLAKGPSYEEGAQDTPSSSASSSSDETPEKRATVLDSIAIIAGTSIGGGFLALPFATAPAGFVPSAVGLLASWFFLVSCGLAFAEATVTKMDINHSAAMLDSEGEADINSDVSVFSVAQDAGGTAFGGLAAVLFAVRSLATISAQDSKAGSLLQSVFPNLPFVALVAAPAGMLGLATFLLPNRAIDRANTWLTGGLLLSFLALVVGGAMLGLSPALLARADWGALVPSFAAKAGSLAGEASLPKTWCLPIFLQLLCFLEVVPVVCSRLGPARADDIKTAIVGGSLVPLAMCLLWSCIAIGLVPYDTASAAKGLLVDPIDALLAAEPLVSLPVTLLAVGAIGTTLIGTYLTFSQFFADLVCGVVGFCSPTTRRICQAATVALPLLLAQGGPQVFYLATAAAGSILYVLWGIIPAASAFRMRLRETGNGKPARGLDSRRRKRMLPGGNLVLAMVLFTSLLMSACQFWLQFGY